MSYRFMLVVLAVAVLVVAGGCFGLDAELGVGAGPFKLLKVEAK